MLHFQARISLVLVGSGERESPFSLPELTILDDLISERKHQNFLNWLDA